MRCFSASLRVSNMRPSSAFFRVLCCSACPFAGTFGGLVSFLPWPTPAASGGQGHGVNDVQRRLWRGVIDENHLHHPVAGSASHHAILLVSDVTRPAVPRMAHH